jgi:hypothetical protein
MLPPDYIDQLFRDFSPGLALLARVRAFYGASFRINLHNEPDGVSHFAIETGGPSLKFEGAIIDLNTTTDRVKAAAMHELLHLSLPIRGFPAVNAMTVTPSATQTVYDDDIRQLDEVLRKTVNIVQHDIFVEEFVASGLPLQQFLAPRSIQPKYASHVRENRGKELIPNRAWLAYSWWLYEYLNNYISIRHGDKRAGRYAGRTIKFGSQLLPDFGQKAAQIRAWVARGKHLSAETYPEAMREIFLLMDYPLIPIFCTLTPVDGLIRVLPLQ